MGAETGALTGAETGGLPGPSNTETIATGVTNCVRHDTSTSSCRIDVLDALTFGTIPELFRFSKTVFGIRKHALRPFKVATDRIVRNVGKIIFISGRKAAANVDQ
jgi:hypothetical protein